VKRERVEEETSDVRVASIFKLYGLSNLLYYLTLEDNTGIDGGTGFGCIKLKTFSYLLKLLTLLIDFFYIFCSLIQSFHINLTASHHDISCF
jgi:hypothetical protein